MILFRFVYRRDKLVRSIIWPAANDQLAQQAARDWVARCQQTWKDSRLLGIHPFRKGLEARQQDLANCQLTLSLQ